MRFRIFGGALLLATTAFGFSPAFSQGLPAGDFVHLGEVAGLNVFRVEGHDGVWMISPDNKTVINGDYYDMSGPVPMLNFEPQPEAEGLSAVSVTPPPVATAPGIGGVQSPVVMDFPEPDQDRFPETAPAEQVAGVKMIDGLFDQLESAMPNVDASVKNEMLVDLVTRMEAAKSPAEFQLLLMEWRAKIAGDKEAEEKAREGLEAIAAGTPEALSAPAGAASASAPVEPLHPAPVQSLPVVTSQDMGAPQVPSLDEVAAAPAPGGDMTVVPAGAQDDSIKLFNQIRNDGHWFSVGRPGAPTVYAIIDPTCPYCARAVNTLAPEIEAGNLDLRVLLSPVVSKAAPAKIAAILLSDDPASTFLQHEKEYAAYGASNIPDRDFSELSAEMNEAIRINHNMVVENGIPGVPFFAYVTADGIKFSSGVPEAGKFAAAEPDPMQSKQAPGGRSDE